MSADPSDPSPATNVGVDALDADARGAAAEVDPDLQAGRRAGPAAALTFVSQGCSSLSNLALLVVVSRAGTSADVGEVAVGLLAYQFAVAAARTLAGDVALVSAPRLTPVLVASMAKVVMRMGVVVGGLLVVAAAALGAGLSSPLLILGLLLAPLLVQDALRYVAFAELQPRYAAQGDGAWLGGFLVVALAVNLGEAQPSAGQWFLLWSVTGALSVVVMAPTRVLRDGAARFGTWWDLARPLSRFYLPELLVGMCTTVVPPLVIAAVASLSEAGELRLAGAYFGPITVAWTAVANIYLPQRARQPAGGSRPEVRLSAAFGVMTLGWVVGGMLVPRHLGVSLLGQTWAGARAWLPALGLGYVALAAASGPILGLRVHNASNLAFRSRALAAPVALVGTILGYQLIGPPGYGIGLTAAALLMSFVAWHHLGAAMRAGRPSGLGIP